MRIKTAGSEARDRREKGMQLNGHFISYSRLFSFTFFLVVLPRAQGMSGHVVSVLEPKGMVSLRTGQSLILKRT